MAKANFYTPKELAEQLKLNVMTVYRYINAGKLKAFKIGKEFRVQKKDFEEFLKSSKVKQ